MLKPLIWSLLAAIALRLLAPVLHRSLGYTALDPQTGHVAIASHASELTELKGKSALVVGGTRGIGRGIAEQLAAAGAHVTISGRSRAGGSAALAAMREAAPSAGQRFDMLPADLFSLEGCRALALELLAVGRRVDYLVVTVGAWPDPVEPRTAEGVNKVIALDIVARFAIIEYLQALQLFNKGAVVLSVLASGKRAPPVSEDRLRAIVSSAVDAWLPEFFAVGPVHDVLLYGAADSPLSGNISHFLGTSPGFVRTELLHASGTFPAWVASVGFAVLDGLGLSAGLAETGLLHAALLNAASQGAVKRRVGLFDHEMVARSPPALMDNAEFVGWVSAYVRSLIGSL